MAIIRFAVITDDSYDSAAAERHTDKTTCDLSIVIPTTNTEGIFLISALRL